MRLRPEVPVTLALVFLALAAPGPGGAQEPVPAGQDVADLDIEELSRIRITSVSRRPEPASRAPAALFVLTREDIRRSGASSLPEALRLVPGLQISRVTGRDWSITSRGFAEQSPNKLLVMVDGRAIYSPLFAGTFWDVQDVVLEDLDRIEVILGSGATLWGSNAVNGVVNVITRTAVETTARLLSLRAGTAEHLNAAGRAGTILGAAGAVRVYGKYRDREAARLADGSAGEDDWRQAQGGFRADFDPTPRDNFTVQGDLYTGSGGQLVRRTIAEPPFAEVRQDELDAHGGNLLARWSRRFGEASGLQVQAYYDRAVREVPTSFGRVAVDIADIELQHRFPLGPGHDFIWGAGYRRNSDTLTGSFATMLVPPSRHTDLITAFAQDEIELVRERWFLTLGTKLERNDFSGLELQPNVRLLWLPGGRHTLWSAVSRAVRIPSRVDTDVRVVSQVLPTSPRTILRFEGNEDFLSEELVTWEAGYRTQVTPTLSGDVSLYYGWYDRLRTVTPLPPFAEGESVVQPFRVDNDLRGHAYGGTAVLNWHPSRTLRLQAAYTLLEMAVRPRDDAAPGSIPNINPGFNPRHQGQLRSSFTFSEGVELDLAMRYVGELPNPRIPDYLEADARLGWSPRPGLVLALAGRDLLASRHAEFMSVPQRELPRRGEVQLEWRF